MYLVDIREEYSPERQDQDIVEGGYGDIHEEGKERKFDTYKEVREFVRGETEGFEVWFSEGMDNVDGEMEWFEFRNIDEEGKFDRVKYVCIEKKYGR